MNKKIVFSVVSIFSALAIMGGATFAAFSDTATTTGNTFATGNADLQVAPDVSGNAGTFVETMPGPTFSGMFPGQTKTFDFWLKNNSTATIPLDLTADISAINPSNDGDQQLDNVLLVSWLCDIDHDNSLGNNTATAEFSPRDWLNGGNASVGSLGPNQQMFCRMIGRLPSSADSTVAGQTVIFDALYGGVQASPTPGP